MHGPASSAFLGRQAEIARLGELLDRHRLVTVTGPGGIGKTTLARHVVSSIADRPTSWSELGEVRSDGHIDEVVALSLGLKSIEEHGVATATPRLLVLDNCEHVVGGAAALVRRLLDESDALHVLATSRLPLDVEEERLIQVSSHDAPSELYRARAGALIGESEAAGLAGIDELCERLDGNPLAIELAAARARSMQPAEISNLIDADLDVLSTRSTLRPPRHRRLDATIAWSEALLSDEHRSVFNRLGAFTTDFSAGDAHWLCGDLTGSMVDTVDVLDELVTHSLLAPSTWGNGRLRMLDTIRRFNRRRLAESGDLAAAERRVLDGMASVADGLWESGKERWPLETILDTVVAFPALRDALEQCIDQDTDPSRAARLLRPLFALSIEPQAGDISRLGLKFEQRWDDDIDELSDSESSFVSDALGAAATASFTLQRYDDAERLARRSIGSDGRRHLGHNMAHWIMGRIERDTGDPKRALDHFEAALTASGRGGSRAAELESEILIAQVTSMLGDRPAAISRLSEVRATALTEDLLIIAVHAATTEAILSVAGDPDNARRSAAAAITLAERIGTPSIVGHNLRTLGVVALTEGDRRDASGYFRRSLESYADGRLDDEFWTTIRWVAEFAEALARTDAANTLRASADAAGPRAPIASPPLSPSPPGAAIDRFTALQLAFDVLEIVEGDETPPAGEPGHRRGIWRRENDVWAVGIDGREITVRHSKGLADIAELIRHPGQAVSVADLAGIVIEGDVGPAYDERARREIEERIRVCQRTIEEAEANNDLGSIHRASDEMDMLIDELSKAHGLGGRARPQHDAVERARSAVTSRIRATIKRLYDLDKPLATHLENSIRTGRQCEYAPDQPIEWQR